MSQKDPTILNLSVWVDAASWAPLAETSPIVNLCSFVYMEATRREIVCTFHMNVASLPSVYWLGPSSLPEHWEPLIIALDQAVGSNLQQRLFSPESWAVTVGPPAHLGENGQSLSNLLLLRTYHNYEASTSDVFYQRDIFLGVRFRKQGSASLSIYADRLSFVGSLRSASDKGLSKPQWGREWTLSLVVILVWNQRESRTLCSN